MLFLRWNLFRDGRHSVNIAPGLTAITVTLILVQHSDCPMPSSRINDGTVSWRDTTELFTHIAKRTGCHKDTQSQHLENKPLTSGATLLVFFGVTKGILEIQARVIDPFVVIYRYCHERW